MRRALPRLRPRWLTSLGAVVLLLALSIPFVGPAAAAPASDAVQLSVVSVTPQTPAHSNSLDPLTIALVFQNNTAVAINNVTINVTRGDPISRQSALDAAMAHPAVPDPGDSQVVIPTSSATFNAPAVTPTPVEFTTTSSIDVQTAGLCLCADAIYPLYITATVTVNGTTTTLASTQTYVPAFGLTPPTPLKVGWLWPLLDVPHRLISPSVFINDDLAAEVSPGGRLYRALTVLENVASLVPMTVVMDPNLIDELEVMAQGDYRVTSGPTTTVAGVGSAAAATWLQDLRDVFTANPSVELDFTPYGDPDIQSLEDNNLPWSTTIPASALTHIETALGGVVPQADIAWPSGETASASTISALAAAGVTTVILNDKTLPGGVSSSPPPNALASLKTSTGTVSAAIVSTTIDSWAAKVLSTSGPGASDIPDLVAQVALRAVESVHGDNTSRYVLIAPPRDVDTDPQVATTAILDTATTSWSAPLGLRAATATVVAANHGSIKNPSTDGVPQSAIRPLRYVNHAISGLRPMFTKADQTSEIGTLPLAIQLAASSSLNSAPDLSGTYAEMLRGYVNTIRSQIYLIKPKNGSYTLTSNSSPLPVTIVNNLSVPIYVNVHAFAVDNLPGFSATAVLKDRIAAKSTVQVRVPTHFDRTGRIQIQVNISTPNGLTLGPPIQLSVRSTALGTIGVVITVVAAVVLVLALLIRFIRQMQERRRKSAPPAEAEAAPQS